MIFIILSHKYCESQRPAFTKHFSTCLNSSRCLSPAVSKRTLRARLATGQAASFTDQHTSSFIPVSCRMTLSQRPQYPSPGNTSVTVLFGWMRNRDAGLGRLKASPSCCARARNEIFLIKLYQPQTVPYP